MEARLVLALVALAPALAGCAAPPASDASVEKADAVAGGVLPFVYTNETTIRWVKAANFGYVAGGVLPDFTFDIPAGASRIEATVEWQSLAGQVSTLTAFLATSGESLGRARGASPLSIVVEGDVASAGGRWQIGAWPGDDPVTANPEETTLAFTVTVS